MSSDNIKAHQKAYKRRHILKLGAFAAGAATLPVACRNATIANQSAPESELSQLTSPGVEASPVSQTTSQTSRVVLVRTDDRVTGTQKAIELLQPQGIKGQTVFLKPNYNTADPAPAATDTALLEALVQELQNAGAGAITVGDRSGMADSRQAMETKGVFQLADRYGLNAIAN